MRSLRVLVLAGLLATIGALSAGATTITYIFTGTVSGTLGSTSFSGAMLTLTAVADTGSIVTGLPGTVHGGPVTATIDISGIGTMTVSNSDYVFDNQPSNKVGYGVNGIPHCCDIIQVVDP